MNILYMFVYLVLDIVFGLHDCFVSVQEQNMSQLRSVFEDADSSRKVRNNSLYMYIIHTHGVVCSCVIRCVMFPTTCVAKSVLS